MPGLIDPISDLSLLTDQAEAAYFTFSPRPDNAERYDQQTGFIESKTTGVSWLIGGNGSGTTECAMYKIARFVMSTPPPRPDTPFWLISDSFEQVMESLWKEKLWGHGHIPSAEVDWDRISWYKPNQNWPFRVPLLPWPGRPNKNWVLEFKSYEQGRQRLQARSIGGFCFSEQFPYALLTEVLRGCREYNFPGSKFCEFTPVDPMLSAPIEEMIEQDTLPNTWEVYRANTECAVEEGHVSREWFDEFYGMIPEEMLLTRLIGAFASYEGAIYQGFNPYVHFVDDEKCDHQPGVYYRRSIDWGAGPSNPFCCLWAYRNGLGQWFVFDEYYSTDQNKTVFEHLEEVERRMEWPEDSLHHGTTWADPSSLDNIRIAQRWGFNMSGAANSVLEGIDYVRQMLQPVPGLNNEPRLFLHRENCPNLSREIRTYRWVQGSDRGLNPRDARPEPLKKDDHAVDALRYLLFSEAQVDGATPTSTSRGGDYSQKGIQLSTSSRSQPLLSENDDRITTGSDNPYVRRARREFFGRRQ
jgi:phage terminase large subunit-like protein